MEKKKPARFQFRLRTLLIVVVAINLLCAAWFSLFGPESSIEWDLSQNHDISTVNWPSDNKENYWWIGGYRKLELKFATEQVIAYVRNIWVDRQNNKISRLKVHLSRMTKQDAYDRALKLTGQWKFNDSGIKKWYNAEKDSMAGHDGSAYGDIDGVDVEIWVKKSFGESRPWYISIVIYYDSAD